MIGRTLDRYRIEAKLGQGGMGVVYKARDTQLDRVVAIKVLPAEMMASADRKQRFVQEARAASALNHPNIVAVYDIRSDAGVDFIVMEYVDGRTLDHTVLSSGLGVQRSLRYAVQIADALARAHEAGIVHRDLKPSNVIVTSDDRVKVLDFGVAKLLDPISDSSETVTRGAPITDAGMAVGTAAYMSPEQAEGKKIDARSDIFSFGAVLYEMITGRRSFAGDSQVAILSKVLNEEPPPPRTIVADLSQDVERTVLRCLRKDPARRFQTMADLKVALDDLLTDSSATVTTRPIVARPAWPWRWAWAVVVPAAIAATYFIWSASQSPAAPATPMGAAVPLTSVPGMKRFPSFSPDGNHVAFSWHGPDRMNQDIYVQQVGAGSPLRLTTAETADTAPAWSPDGRSIAFLRSTSMPRVQEIRLIAPLGGPERKLADIQPRGFLRAVTMAWCPDSTCLVVTDTQGGDKADALFVVSTAGEKRQLTQPSDGILADNDPAISPDGRWLAFRRDVAPFSGQLQVVALGNDLTVRGEPRAVTPVLMTAYGPKWISNGELVFYAKGALWRLRHADGTPERLPVGEDGLMPAVSRPLEDGTRRLAYARSFSDSNIWRIDTPAAGTPAPSPPVLAVASTRRDVIGHVSPDGRRLTFISDRSGESEVWASDTSGANAIQLTSLGANPGYPRWSPDGQMIVFHTNAEDRPTGDVYLVPAEGGKVRNLTSHALNDVFASFSTDGRSVYFCSHRSGAPFIWKMPVSGGEPVKVTPVNAMLAVESTDGASLFYVESNSISRAGPVWQLPLSGGNPVKLTDNASATSVEAIGSGLYYLEQLPGNTRLQFYNFATRRTTTIAANLGPVGGSLAVSRDGRTIYFSRVDSATEDLMLVEKFR